MTAHRAVTLGTFALSWAYVVAWLRPRVVCAEVVLVLDGRIVVPHRHFMFWGRHALLTLAVVLASQSGDSACQTTLKACEIDTRGIRVEDGIITDVLTVTCDPVPRTHRLDGWIEYRASPGDRWRVAGIKRTDHTRPDAQGLRMPLSAGRCIPGDYRPAWQTNGIGPDPGERPFNYTDGDAWATTLDCEES